MNLLTVCWYSLLKFVKVLRDFRPVVIGSDGVGSALRIVHPESDVPKHLVPGASNKLGE